VQVGDLVRWKEHIGVISEKDTYSDRTGWYTVAWVVPWMHVHGMPVTHSTLHREFLEMIARG